MDDFSPDTSAEGEGLDGGGWDDDEIHPTWREVRDQTCYTPATAHARRTAQQITRVLGLHEWDRGLYVRWRVAGDGRPFVSVRLEADSWDQVTDALDR